MIRSGNTIQLSLALARLFCGPGSGSDFLMPDRQALTSLCSFLIGSFLGRIGDKYGAKSRGWLAIGTLLQAALTLAASLCAIYAHQSGLTDSRDEASWTDTLGFFALAFASASMGLQALLGTRLGAQFATYVLSSPHFAAGINFVLQDGRNHVGLGMPAASVSVGIDLLADCALYRLNFSVNLSFSA